ncbi:MAG TPA: hypothetical protein QF665_05820, partial [Alphaproteobacteria bacterium]|nr:hypothetical protein [Alphaproteobacteria bacterium]
MIAPGLGEVLLSNCFENGLLPIVLDTEIVEGRCRLFAGGPEQFLHQGAAATGGIVGLAGAVGG